MADFEGHPGQDQGQRIQDRVAAFNADEHVGIPCAPAPKTDPWDPIKWPAAPEDVDEDACDPDLLPLAFKTHAVGFVAVELTGCWRAVLKKAICKTTTTLYVALKDVKRGTRALEVFRRVFEDVVVEEKEQLNVILLIEDWGRWRLEPVDCVRGFKTRPPCACFEQAELVAGGPYVDQAPFVGERRADGTTFLLHPCEPAKVIEDAPLAAHKHVAVGGTFDRLHAGHRLLLSAAALVAEEVVFLGISGDALLTEKKHAALLEPLAIRSATAQKYLEACRPGLSVRVSTLSEAPPLAVSDASITALVVSSETLAGAQALAKARRDAGVTPDLEIIAVDLVRVAGRPKTSSSALRARDAREPRVIIRDKDRPGGDPNVYSIDKRPTLGPHGGMSFDEYKANQEQYATPVPAGWKWGNKGKASS